MKRSHHHSQRGVIAMTTPIIIVLVLVMTTLLLDGARLYAAKKEMQSIANSAAAAAAQFTQACASVDGLGDLDQIIADAVADRWDGEGEISQQVGLLQSVDSAWQFSPRPVLESNAVGVRYQRQHPVSLLLGRFGEITLESTAVAYKETSVSMTAQGSVADLDTDDSLLLSLVLGEIIGMDGGLSLSNVGFDALSNMLVDAERLVARVAEIVGTPVADILESDVTAEIILEALRDVSDATGPAAVALDQLAAAAGANTNIMFSDVITAVGSGGVPPGSGVPIIGLINSTLLNVGRALPDIIRVDVGDSGLLGPVLGNVGAVRLEIIIDSAPGFVIGPAMQDADGEWLTRTRGADVVVRAIADIDITVPLVLRIQASLPLELQLGSVEAELVAALCASGVSNDVLFEVDTRAGLLDLATNTTASVNVLSILPLPAIQVTISGNSSEPEGVWVRESFGPFRLHANETESASIGNSSVTLSNAVSGLLSSLTINGLGQPLLGNVAGILTPIIQALSEALIEPLVSALGLSVGGGDVTLSVPTQTAVIVLEEVDF